VPLARVAWVAALSALPFLAADVHGGRTVGAGPAACLGTWEGSAVQDGEPWTIAMTVTSTSGKRCGAIDYPSLGCGGDLIGCSVRGARVHFREYYRRNPGTCAPAGTIDARCEGDSMVWVWQGSGMTIRTTLRRSRGSR
jgi:hypothetical protein